MSNPCACLLLLASVAAVTAQDAPYQPTEVRTYKAGGTPIAIPAPTTAMAEVGYENRECMEIFVPTQNRLLAAFVLADELPGLSRGDEDLRLSTYAIVQVPRRGEYQTFRKSDFLELADTAADQFGRILSSSMADAEAELNRRMESLNLDDATIRLGQPLSLGCLFSKQDAYGFGMIMAVSQGGETHKIGMGGAIIRARNRMLFLYLYTDYKDADTVTWLRTRTAQWADAVLQATATLMARSP